MKTSSTCQTAPQPAMPTAQVPSKGGTEFAAPQSDRLVGDCDATLGEKVFDIPEAEWKPMIEPHNVTDDLTCEAVTSILGFHRSSVPHRCQLDNSRWRPRGRLTGFMHALDRFRDGAAEQAG